MSGTGPFYELGMLQAKVASGDFLVTKRVQRYLSRKGISTQMPATCIAALKPSDHHKSLLHHRRSGVGLDVYRPTLMGERWYVKVVAHEDGERVVVLSCCRDGEAH